MVGQSILLKVAEGDTIRLKNFGGDIYEDESRRKENFLHFTGVLLYSSDRSWILYIKMTLFFRENKWVFSILENSHTWKRWIEFFQQKSNNSSHFFKHLLISLFCTDLIIPYLILSLVKVSTRRRKTLAINP